MFIKKIKENYEKWCNNRHPIMLQRVKGTQKKKDTKGITNA